MKTVTLDAHTERSQMAVISPEGEILIEPEVFAERDRKLEEARRRRAETRTRARAESDACVKEAVPA